MSSKATMRIALGVEYDGSGFHGWQRQDKVSSVQQYLEEALAQISNTKIVVHCAGRTDAGVHATGQVVHFDTEVVRPDRAWTMGLNANVPDAISVRWVARPGDEFHARYSATARRYRYLIFNHPLRSGILPHGVTHVYRQLNVDLMMEAAQALVGEHDFSSFRAANCQSNSPFRNMHHVSLHRQGNFIILDIQANAFVHHMVRNITGSLIEVGAGERPVEWIADVLAAKDRTKAGPTARPNGLYLVDVTYPDKFQLPRSPIGPLFLTDEHF